MQIVESCKLTTPVEASRAFRSQSRRPCKHFMRANGHHTAGVVPDQLVPGLVRCRLSGMGLGIYRLRVRSIEQRYRERRRAEEALRQAHADLIHANRVSSMGELTASLAHEVIQPITAALIDASSCLRWLTRDRPDLDQARASASRSVKSATHATEIIKRVSLLFKKGSLQRELVDLNEIIREMMLLLHSEATRFAVLVRTGLAADLPWVMGDRVQLQQVLLNLIMNSIDAMKGVDWTRELTIQSQVGENGDVMISVSDTGVGLPPQQADKIFNAFFTTKTHGTGMGLWISRSIIESNGGHLWAAGNSPRGARFWFTLPNSDETRNLVVSRDRTGPADGPHANNPTEAFISSSDRPWKDLSVLPHFRCSFKQNAPN
jgi:signal transduction histidine kinase